MVVAVVRGLDDEVVEVVREVTRLVDVVVFDVVVVVLRVEEVVVVDLRVEEDVLRVELVVLRVDVDLDDVVVREEVEALLTCCACFRSSCASDLAPYRQLLTAAAST